MRKLFILAGLILWFSSSVFAQHTTVTATVKDPLNAIYRTCTGSANFTGQNTTPGSGPYLLGGSVFQTVVPISCDSKGQFLVSLADNLQITPTPSQWSFSLCTAIGIFPGPPICFTTLITITGATQDVTAQLQAASATLPPYTVILETNGVPNGSQALLNLIAGSNITITDDGHGNVTIASSGGGGGGGGGLPDPGTNGIVTRVGVNTTSFIPNAAKGSALVSNGTGVAPIMQTKPVYDVRDFGAVQDGVTDDTTSIGNILTTIGSNNATVMFTGPSALESITFSPNVKVKFEKTAQLKPISSSTPLGGAGFVQGSGSSNVNTLTSSCSVTLSGTVAGNTIIFMENHSFTAATIGFGSVTDNQGGHYTQLVQQGFNFTSVNSGWAHSNIPGGSVTVTVPYKDNLAAPVNVANGCIAWEISGMGPVVASETSAAGTESGSAPSTTMSAGAITTSAGALVIGFGGQSFLNQGSCTPAAGFTQPAGSAGFISGGSQPSTGYGFNLCATYKLVSPGGSQTPTQTITADPLNLPLNKYWAYAAASIIPSSSVINIQGAIDAPPQQIFTNSLAGQGTIDLTGNTLIDKVFPEWWGASPQASAATNTPAIQAAVVGAFGSNRNNGSQANVYNRELHFSGLYNINGTISVNHMNGFRWTCTERFACGLNQTATNASIITTTTGGTYGSFEHFLWQTTASQDLNHPLVDLNYTAAPGNDLVTQFIDFPYNTFNGNLVATTGLRIAAAGGTAQGSNITHMNNAWLNFTEAAYMVGSGSGCVPTTLAANAIAIDIINGDFQRNQAYAFENFGGGSIKFHGTTFEDGFGASTNIGIQTGYDVCGQVGAAGEFIELDNVRSESLYTLGGSGPYVVKNMFSADQAFVLAPGSSPAIGTTIQGSGVGGHGAYYTTTGTGTWTGIGAPSAPVIATSGTGTTLTNNSQSVAGSQTIGLFVKLETVTQAVTGSTGTLLNVPVSSGTITGSVTSGTIVSTHTVTQAVTGVTCKVVGTAPVGSASLFVQQCSGTADNSHVWTDGGTGGTYTPTSAPVFGVASPTMIITAATGAPDNSHNWTGGTSGAVYVPTAVPVNIANYTVNQWVGFNLSLIGGTGNGEYCVITANAAQSFTCAGGWLTDFSNIGAIVNPDNTSTYIVEPQWGVQTSNGGVTWTAITKKISGLAIVDGFFVPGLQVGFSVPGLIRGMQVTRADWAGTGDPDNIYVASGQDAIVAGVPSGGVTGTGAGTLGDFRYVRPYKFTRNGITETPYAQQKVMGTAVQHFLAGISAGGTATVDVYTGADPSTGTKNGRYFIENNSSGSPKFTYFNADGSSNLPGSLLWTTDNATDIGAVGATRPRTVYAGTSVVTPILTSTGVNGGFSGTEGTGASVPAGAGLDVMWSDSTAHRWLMNNNNEATNENLAGTLPSGNVTTAGTVVNAGTCQAQTGITVTGALTTDNVIANIGAVLPATWQTGIVLSAHVTAGNTVTVYLCNGTAGNITPAATQVNVRILR